MAPIEDWLAEAPQFCQKNGRPLITISYAQSLDGSLTTRSGEQPAISGRESMRMTHALRAAHKAILIGVGTVLSDDPQLTVRLVEGEQPQPIILDSKLRIPITARLFEHPKGIWIASGKEVPSKQRKKIEEKGAQIVIFPLDSNQHVNLIDLMKYLAGRGICSVMVEGGPTVISSFLRQGLVDQVVLTIAPRLIGGKTVQIQSTTPDWACSFIDVGYARLGEDLIFYGRPRRGL
jgi:GTP cyclohydrolase II